MQYISREISIGDLLLGGSQPIRLQSMTNTNTIETVATVEQSIRMTKAGCEMVRITAPGPREAAHLKLIKQELERQGYSVPIIADIHFNPAAAEIAATTVEKVRINPGNYAERTAPDKVFWTDTEYEAELNSIATRLGPLLKICSRQGTAIRIGVNHGSLSQRIVSRYGDTPEGMVQSALEFTRICHNEGFNDLVLSMKSSNVRIMVEAYRLLAARLQAEGLNYPLHLGVTEAGDGEDGRLKSIAGIGALLARGIGDTIRVSLTEDPEYEIPVARQIVERFQTTDASGKVQRKIRPDLQITSEIYCKRETLASGPIGGNNPVALLILKNEQLFLAGENGAISPLPHQSWKPGEPNEKSKQLKWFMADEVMILESPGEIINQFRIDEKLIILAKAGAEPLRKLAKSLSDTGLKNPLILSSTVVSETTEHLLTENSLNPGNLLIDGVGDGICLDVSKVAVDDAIRIGLGLLQATRMRISRTEFIACPSCGRTLFNIQDTLQQVKARTGHLKGLRIGVMGCIVNGPGEMADAHYGYVGSGKGKVTLYKGKVPVKRGIPESEAVDALVELIKEGGDWVPIETSA